MVRRKVETDVQTTETVSQTVVFCDACLDECTADWEKAGPYMLCPDCDARMDSADAVLDPVGDARSPDRAGWLTLRGSIRYGLIALAALLGLGAIAGLAAGEIGTFLAGALFTYITWRAASTV